MDDPSTFETFRLRCRGELPTAAERSRRIVIPTTDLTVLPEGELWALHTAAIARYREGAQDDDVATSLLDLKVELGQRLLGPCRLCFLRCPVDRRAGERGACGLGAELRPYRDFVHLGEELELVPTHAIYLAGCSYRCVYCSDWAWVERPAETPEVETAALAASLQARRREGALSHSFVGGSPDVNLPGLLAAIAAADGCGPVVWNSNLSGTPEAHDLLEGVVDAWVADLKYGREVCSTAGSTVKGALAVAQRNLRRAAAEAYVVVRHLVLPDHVDCCTTPVLDWLAAELPQVRVNLMPQFEPTPEVAGTAWDRRPTPDELTRAQDHAAALGLDLQGPGRVIREDSRARPLPIASAPPVAGFESAITIGADGRVVVRDLDPGLAAALSQALGGDVVFQERTAAAEPWLRPPEGTRIEPEGGQ